MIELRRTGRITVLTMNAPRANALGDDLLDALVLGIDAALVDNPGALVITGHGNSFSAGLALPDLIGRDRAGVRAAITRFTLAMRRILECPLPVVAAINGHAIAGGCVLALMCDVRVMVRDGAKGAPKIGLNEAQLGIGLPAVVIEPVRARLPAASHVPVALEGRLFEPGAAVAAGLVDEVAGETDFEARVLARATALAAASPPAYAQIKRALLRVTVEAIDRHDASETEAWLDTWFSDDGQRRLHDAVARITKRP
jgi:enoyl-CoA hydratase